MRFHWIKSLLRLIQNIFLNLFFDNKRGGPDPETFSIGRTGFNIWFYVTCLAMIKAIYFENPIVIASIPPGWWMIGLSLLGYVIGTKYIVSKFSAFSSNITSIKIDDEKMDHIENDK